LISPFVFCYYGVAKCNSYKENNLENCLWSWQHSPLQTGGVISLHVEGNANNVVKACCTCTSVTLTSVSVTSASHICAFLPTETDYATYSGQPIASQICGTLPPTTEVPSSLIMFRGIQYTTRTRKILIIKLTRCTNFSNLFLEETLLVSDSSSVHHKEFFTVHTAMVYVIQFC